MRAGAPDEPVGKLVDGPLFSRGISRKFSRASLAVSAAAGADAGRPRQRTRTADVRLSASQLSIVIEAVRISAYGGTYGAALLWLHASEGRSSMAEVLELGGVEPERGAPVPKILTRSAGGRRERRRARALRTCAPSEGAASPPEGQGQTRRRAIAIEGIQRPPPSPQCTTYAPTWTEGACGRGHTLQTC